LAQLFLSLSSFLLCEHLAKRDKTVRKKALNIKSREECLSIVTHNVDAYEKAGLIRDETFRAAKNSVNYLRNRCLELKQANSTIKSEWKALSSEICLTNVEDFGEVKKALQAKLDIQRRLLYRAINSCNLEELVAKLEQGIKNHESAEINMSDDACSNLIKFIDEIKASKRVYIDGRSN